MSSQRSGCEGQHSGGQADEDEETLDLRYPPAPFCKKCRKKVEMKAVETVTKASLGRLYYTCNGCGYFQWVHPYSATWTPSGIPVRPPAREVVDLDMHEVNGKKDKIGEEASTVCGMNTVEKNEASGHGKRMKLEMQDDNWKFACLLVLIALLAAVVFFK